MTWQNDENLHTNSYKNVTWQNDENYIQTLIKMWHDKMMKICIQTLIKMWHHKMMKITIQTLIWKCYMKVLQKSKIVTRPRVCTWPKSRRLAIPIGPRSQSNSNIYCPPSEKNREQTSTRHRGSGPIPASVSCPKPVPGFTGSRWKENFHWLLQGEWIIGRQKKRH